VILPATAAIVTVGTEITSGLRLDTNTREIALALLGRGYETRETVSVPDDVALVASEFERLVAAYELIVVTGGLGPTHDDITRQAASQALGRAMYEDASVVAALQRWVGRHQDPDARAQVLSQAQVIEGATLLPATVGTAPGLDIPTEGGSRLILLPGPPSEMRPMLDDLLVKEHAHLALPVEIACVGIPESDAQITAQRVLTEHPGVKLALLASPGDVHVVLMDGGAGERGLAAAAQAVGAELGAHCYSDDGSTLAEVVVRLARSAGVTVATAESCTGGLVGAALTSVPGASETYLGGVIAYSNEVKIAELDVPPGLLAQYGAVSEQTARAMAEGVLARFGAGVAVATTGIAGPDGGTNDKPVGTVWFAIADETGSRATLKNIAGDRAGVRARATTVALDLLRATIERQS